jgi:predicted DCC family thiol-disulfide oxidoreductase YuxK
VNSKLSPEGTIAKGADMPNDDSLTVFYDAACPVCAFEIDLLRRRDAGRALHLVDISAPGFDARLHGFSAKDLYAALHAVHADGSVERGMAALRLVYTAAGLGWLVKATRWRLLRGPCEAAYRLFARHRHAISRALAPCLDGARARSSRDPGRST